MVSLESDDEIGIHEQSLVLDLSDEFSEKLFVEPSDESDVDDQLDTNQGFLNFFLIFKNLEKTINTKKRGQAKKYLPWQTFNTVEQFEAFWAKESDNWRISWRNNGLDGQTVNGQTTVLNLLTRPSKQHMF